MYHWFFMGRVGVSQYRAPRTLIFLAMLFFHEGILPALSLGPPPMVKAGVIHNV